MKDNDVFAGPFQADRPRSQAFCRFDRRKLWPIARRYSADSDAVSPEYHMTTIKTLRPRRRRLLIFTPMSGTIIVNVSLGG